MCCVCGRVHNDLRTVEGTELEVCLSARYCLIEALRNAPENDVRYIHMQAITRARLLTPHPERTMFADSKRAAKYTRALKPVRLGIDTE